MVIVLVAWLLFTPALLLACLLVDHTGDLVGALRRRRRLRRLRTTSVVRPRCVVLPSPGRRAATFPRRGAVHSSRRHP